MTELKTKCPQCRKLMIWDSNNPFRPFCSEKCRLIDLGNWANENYTIDGGQAPSKEEDDQLL